MLHHRRRFLDSGGTFDKGLYHFRSRTDRLLNGWSDGFNPLGGDVLYGLGRLHGNAFLNRLKLLNRLPLLHCLDLPDDWFGLGQRNLLRF